MEGGFNSDWKNLTLTGLDSVDEEEELKNSSALPAIPHPQTPAEPMEFLSRSWSVSASEISKALSQKQTWFFPAKNFSLTPEITVVHQLARKTLNSHSSRRTGALGKWFHHKDHGYGSSNVKTKDRQRVENARMHSALSVAALATALAAVAAAEKSKGSGSRMSLALASATELLASHCLEIAELAGADHNRVASVVRSAVDVRSPGDLMTLTAAAATALRGEAALGSRLPKEARKNAAVSPYDRLAIDSHLTAVSDSHREEQNTPYVGELLQLTRKGVLRWKHVCVYINKNSQVMVKLKSKHVGGAFSKKSKSVVYGVCDESTAWPYKKERGSSEEVYFGLKTAQGLLEFKCRNKMHKQKWVDEIQNLLRRVNCIQAAAHPTKLPSVR